MNCTNDFTPIILAVAGILSIQVPLIITAFINSLKTKHDISVAKANSYDTVKKVDELTLITMNGFHGPPGPAGPRGEPGAPGKVE